MTRHKAEAALVWNAAVWGSTFVLVKAALADISPMLFLALRFTLASLALGAIFAGKRWARRKNRGAGERGRGSGGKGEGLAEGLAGAGVRSPAPGLARGASLAAGSLVGFFLFAGYAFQTFGLRLTSAPKSAFITGLSAVLVPLVAALVYRAKPRISEVCGLAVATAGLTLMTIPDLAARINPGDLLTVCCAVAYASHIVVLGHFAGRVNFETLALTQVVSAAALSLAAFWWVEPVRMVWSPATIGAILITGLFATALAFSIQSWAQQFTTSTRTALIYMLEPVFAWITSFLLAGEGLSRRAGAGAALILAGVVLVELKPLNRPREGPDSAAPEP